MHQVLENLDFDAGDKIAALQAVLPNAMLQYGINPDQLPLLLDWYQQILTARSVPPSEIQDYRWRNFHPKRSLPRWSFICQSVNSVAKHSTDYWPNTVIRQISVSIP
ncbi:MAG: hypothetical protein LRY40_06595 [Shewanella fodinae]|nr:hypothetical protein [Shewanella fodinae]